eukprot:6178893-Pleurochrysis_carterae.AAC.2
MKAKAEVRRLLQQHEKAVESQEELDDTSFGFPAVKTPFTFVYVHNHHRLAAASKQIWQQIEHVMDHAMGEWHTFTKQHLCQMFHLMLARKFPGKSVHYRPCGNAMKAGFTEADIEKKKGAAKSQCLQHIAGRGQGSALTLQM